MTLHAHPAVPSVEQEPDEVAYRMTDPIREALKRIGRTEDAQFSPSGRRVAIAGFGRQRILVLELTLELTPTSASVTFDHFLEIKSEALSRPHGLFWLDEQILFVANRCGDVAIFTVPLDTSLSCIKLEPIRALGAEAFIDSPGSVSAATIAPGIVELLVCNNYVHTITRHLLDRHADFEPFASEVLLKSGLEVPDGIAQSASGRWIAVSNHNKNVVFLYRNDGTLNRASAPDGILRGVLFPHGLRFCPDETSLIVADAGSPFIHVFESSDGEWFGERSDSKKLEAVGAEDFERGHYSRDEGGPKGIGLTHNGSLLIASCEERPLAIFDVRSIVGSSSRPVDEFDAICSREAIIRYGRSSNTPIRLGARLIASDLQHWAQLLFVRWAWKIKAPMWSIAKKLSKSTRVPQT